MNSTEVISELVNIILCSESEEGHAYLDALEEARAKLNASPQDGGEWHDLLKRLLQAYDSGENSMGLLPGIESRLPPWAQSKIVSERTAYNLGIEEQKQPL